MPYEVYIRNIIVKSFFFYMTIVRIVFLSDLLSFKNATISENVMHIYWKKEIMISKMIFHKFIKCY